ncbi:MAG: hypothetical protein IJ776_06945 [Paludibacteraceae bacterium]|nr:hypothetical protein [Paludibacteraceae bacterium]
MKYKILICFIIVASLVASAQESDRVESRPVELRAFGAYAYNYTWSHYGNLDLWARIPLNRHFELDGAAELSTANVYTFSLDARPLFCLPVGEMYLDTRLLYKAVARNRTHEFAAALGLGYRMDYVDVQLGVYSRFLMDFGYRWHSEDEIVAEPFGFLYSIEVFVRPRTSNWNLSLRFSDTDDYQIERLWQPLFMIGGRYSPIERLSVLLQAQCKPTGMFHLNASFYGAVVRAGISYRF